MTSKNLLNSDKFSNTDFEQIVKNAPGHVYWKDKDGVYLGCNLQQAISYGFKSPKDVIGKSDFDILDHETAEMLRKNDLEVMNSRKAHVLEESTECLTNKKQTFLSHKTPLIDAKGEVAGILGVSLDITKQLAFADEKPELDRKITKAALTNILGDERNFLKSKTCVLTISMGQNYHEGDKLRASLKAINSFFKNCTIALCDTSQRHSLAILEKDQTADELYDLSLKLGDEWLERNIPIIEEELKIPHKIIRWDQWFKSPKFEENYKRVEELYLTNSDYQKTVKRTINSFFLRKRKEVLQLVESDCFDLSLNYILEECACMLQWFEDKYDYEIYPPLRNDAISQVFALLEPSKNKNQLVPLGLKFSKISNSEALNISNIALENVINTLPGHVYWKDRNGVFLGCNLQQAKSFKKKNIQSVVGQSDFDLLEYDQALELRLNDLQIIKSKRALIKEEHTEYLGKRKTFLSHKTPLKSAKGDVIGILGVSLDITKQKELERKLQVQTAVLTETVHAKDRFLNNVSHEIRTPLHVIGALVDELSRNYHTLSDQERIDYINFTKQSTERLGTFVNNILEAAKGKKGELTLKLEKADIAKITKTVVSELAVISKSPISIKAEEGKYFADCTKYQIEQVVRNLAANAIRYGKETPIEVIVSSDDKNIRVEVTDQGIGVPENERLSIFEAFEESSRTKTMAGGTGLGLAICKDIINLHNGKIWVESKNNVGSQFIFTLPINQGKQ